jgi:hypothetical protein
MLRLKLTKAAPTTYLCSCQLIEIGFFESHERILT